MGRIDGRVNRRDSALKGAADDVRAPIAEMGRIAFERLLAVLDGAKAPPLTRLPVELIVRRSVAPLQQEVSA